MKKVIGLFICVIMVISLFPAFVAKASEPCTHVDAEPADGKCDSCNMALSVYVGGIKLEKDQYLNNGATAPSATPAESGTGYVYFTYVDGNANSAVLTMNNATVVGPSATPEQPVAVRDGISANGNLKIYIMKDSTVVGGNMGDSGGGSHGISVEGALHIDAIGTLIATGGESKGNFPAGHGISSTDITASGTGSVTAIGGSNTIAQGVGGNGIICGSLLTNVTVTAIGGSSTASAGGHGIYIGAGIGIFNETVESNLVAQGGKGVGVGTGIFSEAPIIVASGKVSAEGHHGIYTTKDFSVTGGNVIGNALADTGNGVHADGNINYSGGVLTATSAGPCAINKKFNFAADPNILVAGGADAANAAEIADLNLPYHENKFVKIDNLAYRVLVGGVQVTSANKGDVLGDGKVSYNPVTCTLNLNGANIVSDQPIYAECNLTVNATAPSTVTGTAEHHGIYVKGYDLTVVSADKANLTVEGGVGIAGTHKVNIADGSNIIVKSITSNAIESNGELVIGKSAIVSATGKTGGIVSKQNMTICPGSIVAVAVTDSNSGDGIVVTNGSIMVDGATLDVTGIDCGIKLAENSNGSIVITNSNVSTSANKYGIYSDKGITITDSQFTIRTGNIGIGTRSGDIRYNSGSFVVYSGVGAFEKMPIMPEGMVVRMRAGDDETSSEQVLSPTDKNYVSNKYLELANGHTITLNTPVSGTVTASPIAAAGDVVVLTVTPDEGFRLKRITVMGDDDIGVTVSNNSFVMPKKNVTVSVFFERLPSTNPPTGDNSPVALWLGLLIVSALGFASIISFSKRKHPV